MVGGGWWVVGGGWWIRTGGRIHLRDKTFPPGHTFPLICILSSLRSNNARKKITPGATISPFYALEVKIMAIFARSAEDDGG